MADTLDRKSTKKAILKESRDKLNGSKTKGNKKDKKNKKDAEEPQQSDESGGYDRKTRFSKELKTSHSRGLDYGEETWKNSEKSEASTPKQSFSFEDLNEGAEEGVTEESSAFELNENGRDRSEKPQIWIRIRPSSKIQDNIFDMTEDGKGVRLIPTTQSDPYNYRQRQTYREQREEQGYVFTSDGVLRNSSQEETYQVVAHDLVDKAMDGISGLIVCVGPELSGKHFTLFGSISKFQYRGILPRCLERIFQICQLRASEMRYLIRMAIVEIRHDKIRDLLTLGTFDGNSFDKDSPHGMVFQKIGAAEHGFGLLIRALTCQKEIPREAYAKPHTVVFIDIYGESYTDGGGGGQGSMNPRIVKSRLTFSKTAPIPERDEVFQTPCSDNSPNFDAYGCCIQPHSLTDQHHLKNNSTTNSCNGIGSNYNGSTCNSMACAKRKTGPVAEAIRIRQDMGYLEQMCSRACQYQKFTKYYERYATIDMPIPQPPPASQHFRLSKLTYCLKDIVSGNAEIRIILHFRPEKRYKHATLEAMRFAEKAKCVPYGMGPPPPSINNLRSEKEVEKPLNFGKDLSIFDFLSKMPSEVSDMYIQINPDTFKKIQEHGAGLFEGKIHAVTDVGESQMHELFEKFRHIWNYVMETGMIPTNIPTTPYKLESSESLPATSNLSRHHSLPSKKEHSLTNIPSNSRHVKTLPSDTIGEAGGGKELSTKKSKSGKSKTNLKKKKSQKSNKSLQNSLNPPPATPEIEDSEVPTTHNTLVPPHTPEMHTSTPGSAVDPDKKIESRATTPDKSKTAIEDALALDADHTRALESREAPTKKEAWTSFLNTEQGSHIFNDLAHKNKVLQDLAGENNIWIKETSHILSSLNKAQTDLNLMQHERFIKGDDYDVHGNILVPSAEKQLKQEIKKLETTRKELGEKLKDIRSQLFTQKNLVEMGKADVENAFQTFALDNYATTYTDHLDVTELTREPPKNIEMMDSDEYQERIRKFEDIKRVAKKQARFFLRALAKKPSWVPY